MYVSSSEMSSEESSLSVIAFPFSAKVSTSQPGCFLAAGGCVPRSCKKELRVRASPSRASWIVLVSVCDVRVLRQQRIIKVGWCPILWWVRVPRARLFQQVGMLFYTATDILVFLEHLLSSSILQMSSLIGAMCSAQNLEVTVGCRLFQQVECAAHKITFSECPVDKKKTFV